MTSSRNRSPWPEILLATLLLPFLAACASPGPPHPPSLHLPETVSDLTAERIGDEVQLHWTTPTKTTDGLVIKDSLTAEVCRETAPAQPHASCVLVTRLPVKPGPSKATDVLSASLVAGPEALLGYRVRILNANGRAATASHVALTAAGAAPAFVEQLRATPSRNGATIEWRPQPEPGAWVELDRNLLPGFGQAAKAPAKPDGAKPLATIAPALPAEVRLQTPKDVPDPGGVLDRTAMKTETYTYQAQRVRSISLAGHEIEMRSALSPVVTVHIADIFPPQTPKGLAAVPGESANSIDLSWEPVPDADLAGYLIYRRAVGSTEAFEKLTPKPVVPPAFTDATATGGSYRYRVTAIDTTGNESQPSGEVEETAKPR